LQSLHRVVAAALAAMAVMAGYAAAAPFAAGPPAARAPTALRNVIIFVADGLRHDSVNATDTPTLVRVRREGVDFANSHALFPTFTTPNASSIATGHYLGDTGDFSNNLYAGFPIFGDGAVAGKAAATTTPFLENNLVLADIDEHFATGNFLNEESLLAVARRQGFRTAAIGKHGPVAIQDVAQLRLVNGRLTEPTTVFIDDETGAAAGVPLSAEVSLALNAAGLAATPPTRNQPAGNVRTPGTLKPNVEQQQYFADVTTRAILPLFRAGGRPFVLVYWSRDPDATQHSQGDSLNSLLPGINGPTARAGVANADANLRQILDYLDSEPTLRDNTDVFVTADHGFATISKHEIDARGRATASYATRYAYLEPGGQPEVIPGWLPRGFLAIDLAHALSLPLFDADVVIQLEGKSVYKPVDPSLPPTATRAQHPLMGSGLIGGTGAVQDRVDAQVVVTANGGSDLIYVPDQDPGRVRRIVAFLNQQDYVGGVFVDSRFGSVPGALPLSAIGLEGTARMPRPAVVVAFRTFVTDPRQPGLSGVVVGDTMLQEGQGMHGSFGRDNTYNNMAAIGPDFKRGYVDHAPVSNADIAQTLAHILRLPLPTVGTLRGRVLEEALAGGPPQVAARRRHALAAADPYARRATLLEYQEVGARRYFDEACMVDLPARRPLQRSALHCR